MSGLLLYIIWVMLLLDSRNGDYIMNNQTDIIIVIDNTSNDDLLSYEYTCNYQHYNIRKMATIYNQYSVEGDD